MWLSEVLIRLLVVIIVFRRGRRRVYIIELLVEELLASVLHRVSIKRHLHRHIVHIIETLVIISVVVIIVIFLLVVIVGIIGHVLVIIVSLLSEALLSGVHVFKVIENSLLRRSFLKDFKHNFSGLIFRYLKKILLFPSQLRCRLWNGLRGRLWSLLSCRRIYRWYPSQTSIRQWNCASTKEIKK